MEQLGYPEHEWGEKWVEAANDKKKWRRGVRAVVRKYKRDLDYDTWENRHTEQDTSFEREVGHWGAGRPRAPLLPEVRWLAVQHTGSFAALPTS